MIFLSEETQEAQDTILYKLDAGVDPNVDVCMKLLKLDDGDHKALYRLGELAAEAGDLAGAEKWFRKAIEIQPCAAGPYLTLGSLLGDNSENSALAEAYSELGISRMSEEEIDDNIELLREGLSEAAAEEFSQLRPFQQQALLVKAAREKRATEPAEATAEVRRFRLLQPLMEEDEIGRELVDAVRAEGPEMVPLLVGVLRGWARLILDENSDAAVGMALGLVGELGSPAELRGLLEFVNLEHESASGASAWALGRIVERYGKAAMDEFQRLAPELGASERLAAGEQSLRHPDLDPDGSYLLGLAANLKGIKSSERDSFFETLLGALAALLGPQGVEVGKKAFVLHRGQLTPRGKKGCEEFLRELATEITEPVRPEPLQWTVYDVCGGTVVWEVMEDEDDEEHSHDHAHDEDVSEPAVKAELPGRNDPCWCDSGKKYKKCHMEADQLGAAKAVPE